MRIYWWQGGVHIEPESDEDCEFLVEGMKVLQFLKTGRKVETSRTGKTSNEEPEG